LQVKVTVACDAMVEMLKGLRFYSVTHEVAEKQKWTGQAWHLY